MKMQLSVVRRQNTYLRKRLREMQRRERELKRAERVIKWARWFVRQGDDWNKMQLGHAVKALEKNGTDRTDKTDHDCDAECRNDSWAMSGFRKSGDRWKCSCGKIYEHVEDEAEGSSWKPV